MSETQKIPDDLKDCIAFHGHLCPGLVYGYRVALQALSLLGAQRAADEEVVAICETDSCSVDAIQMVAGTTSGKGNLAIRDWGKTAFTFYHRPTEKGYRFVRKTGYTYTGDSKEEFETLDKAFSEGSLSASKRWRLKLLKAMDLIRKPFDDVFSTAEVPYQPPAEAQIARSVACDACHELAMKTKTIKMPDGRRLCIPCSRNESANN